MKKKNKKYNWKFKNQELQMERQKIENERKIKEMKLSHQRNMDDLKEQLNEKDEKLTTVSTDLNELKNEKVIQQNNEQESLNEFEENSPQILSEYSENNKNSIFEKLSNSIVNYIDSQHFFDRIKKELIPKVIEKEDFSYSLKQYMDKKVNSLKENAGIKINHFNILIMGPTGVGKSTLINVILKKKIAETGIGFAVTQGKPHAYESENRKGIRLCDSKGIESGKYGIKQANYDIKETIDK